MTKSWLKPNWDSGVVITQISNELLLEKGLQGLVLDVDNTLVAGSTTDVDETVINWINNAKKDFRIHLLSNNPSKERIEKIALQLDLNYVYRGLKPRRGSLRKVLNQLGLDHSKVAIIGDRLLTDILVGNRQGIYTILVKPIRMANSKERYNSIQFLERLLSKLFSLF